MIAVGLNKFCVWFIIYIFFFFNDTATTEIYTLSLHDALPISNGTLPSCTTTSALALRGIAWSIAMTLPFGTSRKRNTFRPDRKSTRLNSSHANISYAVFCLKKKKNITYVIRHITM